MDDANFLLQACLQGDDWKDLTVTVADRTVGGSGKMVGGSARVFARQMDDTDIVISVSVTYIIGSNSEKDIPIKYISLPNFSTGRRSARSAIVRLTATEDCSPPHSLEKDGDGLCVATLARQHKVPYMNPWKIIRGHQDVRFAGTGKGTKPVLLGEAVRALFLTANDCAKSGKGWTFATGSFSSSIFI